MEVLKLIGKNFANLLKVKTILSLAVIFTTCVLTFKNVISVEAFMAIASAIITFTLQKKRTRRSNYGRGISRKYRIGRIYR